MNVFRCVSAFYTRKVPLFLLNYITVGCQCYQSVTSLIAHSSWVNLWRGRQEEGEERRRWNTTMKDNTMMNTLEELEEHERKEWGKGLEVQTDRLRRTLERVINKAGM